MYPQPRRFRKLGFFGLTVTAFGLLLWARLLLVSSPPRIATADPVRPAATPMPQLPAVPPVSQAQTAYELNRGTQIPTP